MRTVASRTHRKRGQGKRTRRALIRLRHALAAERFIRWLYTHRGLSGDFYKPHRMEARNWHQWHSLGGP